MVSKGTRGVVKEKKDGWSYIQWDFNKKKGWSTVMEIQWEQSGITYTGLLLLYPNNTGCFKVKYFYGSWIWCYQDARLTSTRDVFGNVTSYINCYNPKCALPYAADNFVIYPNGNMYTQDAAGNWSTLIQAVIIDPRYWAIKKNEYGLR